MELAGMRWSELGAEAMLELRSIKVNNKWDSFWGFFTGKEKQKLYADYEYYFDQDKDEEKKLVV